MHTLLEEKGLRLSGLVLEVMSDLHLSLDLRNPLLDTVCTHVVLVVLIQRKAAECAITQQRLQQTMCSSLYILLVQCSINMQQRLHCMLHATPFMLICFWSASVTILKQTQYQAGSAVLMATANMASAA